MVQTRPIVTGPKQVVVHIPASDLYRRWLWTEAICTMNVCQCLNIDKMMESAWLTLYENKIEWNVPYQFCCCTCDSTSTLYYDRNITAQATKAGVCTPCCTHMMLCPTCCDICGEAVILHGGTICSPNQAILPGTMLCACKTWTSICGYDNAEGIASQILQLRTKAVSNALMPQQMQMPGQQGYAPAPQG
eukprot:Colp12_sorted_trinity150504_noHs@32809